MFIRNNNLFSAVVVFAIIAVFLPLTFIEAVETEEIDIELSVSEIFGINQAISFDYVIIANQDIEIKYFVDVSCESAPHAPYIVRQENLIKKQPFRDFFESFTINDSIEPQICTASIVIIEPIQKTISKEFEIITDPSFSFDINLNKKVFIQKENININYTSEVENPAITATLTYPDKTIKQITLPTLIKAEQIGVYYLEATVKKDGYKDNQSKIEFGVIKKEAKIVNEAEMVKKNKEEYRKKLEIEQKFKKYGKPFLIILAIGFVLSFCLIIIRKRMKKE
ncbi:MAG: hypothetical protein ABIH48_02355 [Candidatus Falkowbacteria bacterium]